MCIHRKWLVGFALIMATISVKAEIVRTSVMFNYDFFHSYASVDSGSKLLLDDVNIDGLEKFDPSLGALTSVTAFVNADYTSVATVFIGAVFGPNIVSVDVSGLGILDFDLLVWGSDGGTRMGSAVSMGTPFQQDSLSCEDLDYCSVNHVESDFIEGSRDATDSRVGLNDYIGTSLLEPGRISFGVIFPEELDFIVGGTDDGAVASVDLIVSGDVILEYEYSPNPVPVPVPAGIWLMGSGLLVVRRLSRKKMGLSS